MFQARVEDTGFDEPVAAKVAACLRTNRDTISHLVERADQLANALQARSLEIVLCHADIHAGNVLISDDGAFYIVDWDTPVLAPKEHDLMMVGWGVNGVWHRAGEDALFYQGYGQTEIDPMALAYYRYERIIQDIAAFCEQLLLSDEGGADREQSLGYLVGQFDPNSLIDVALASDQRL
jgi:spectinomycin phosphotransferase